MKYYSKSLKELLVNIHNVDMVKQKEIISNDFALHKGNEAQRDDVTFIGLRFRPNNLKEILNYDGLFTHQQIVSLGEELNQKLSGLVSIKKQKDAFFTANELMQNICHYSENMNGKELSNGNVDKISVRLTSESIEIIASNSATIENYERVKSKVDYYNKLTEDQLKAVRKEILKADGDMESKGAGIGLLEIFRRTKSPLIVTYEENESGIGEIKFHAKINLGERNG